MSSTVGAGSILKVLSDQHARTRELLCLVADGKGPDRRAAFDALRRVLAVHEAAEDFVLRPAAHTVIPRSVVKAHLEDERRLGEMIEHLERLDLDGNDFQDAFFSFSEELIAHMWSQEAEEWHPLELRWSDEEQSRLGAWLYRAFAPDPANPTARTSDRAVPAGSVARLSSADIARLEYRALFQEAVDRLAESRWRDERSRYFETAPVAA
ncbi:hemerythrin domain-containing protein [Actinospica robiniae]|uniref:hemerythrin domain-containing protein n=1 Tax=Actinospica robiniae TaxID=304901 RepID=UPI000402AD6D|nr:hemerythrin domain-containing protein [Actinospica robiniae]